MSYDIYFVRRDPGQAFEDALEDAEGSFDPGDPRELSDVDLEQWDEVLAAAREIFGDVDVEDDDDSRRQLVARRIGVELTLIPGEIEIHIPENRPSGDAVDLMGEVYELARAVERVTGLEGYDPQLGEPVSDRDREPPARRRRPGGVTDNDDDDDAEPSGTTRPLPRPDMTPDPKPPISGRRWWEFWKQ